MSLIAIWVLLLQRVWRAKSAGSLQVSAHYTAQLLLLFLVLKLIMPFNFLCFYAPWINEHIIYHISYIICVWRSFLLHLKKIICVNFTYPVALTVSIFATSPSIFLTLLFCGIKANIERKSLQVQLTIFWSGITYLVFFPFFFL